MFDCDLLIDIKRLSHFLIMLRKVQTFLHLLQLSAIRHDQLRVMITVGLTIRFHRNIKEVSSDTIFVISRLIIFPKVDHIFELLLYVLYLSFSVHMSLTTKTGRG